MRPVAIHSPPPRGHEKKFTRLNATSVHLDRAVETDEKRKRVSLGGTTRLAQIPFLNAKIRASQQCLALRSNHFGREVLEGDCLERFRDVQLARLPLRSDARPIEETKSRIAVLLDFDEQITPADGVETASRHEESIPGSQLDSMHERRGGAIAHRLLELAARDAGSQAGINLSVVIRRREIPHFGFGFAAEGAAPVASGWTWSESFSCASSSLARIGKRGVSASHRQKSWRGARTTIHAASAPATALA